MVKKIIATIFWTSLNVDTNQKIDIRQKEQRNFAINFDFISLYLCNPVSKTLDFLNYEVYNLSLKYLRSHSGCKDIGIIDFGFSFIHS